MATKPQILIFCEQILAMALLLLLVLAVNWLENKWAKDLDVELVPKRQSHVRIVPWATDEKQHTWPPSGSCSRRMGSVRTHWGLMRGTAICTDMWRTGRRNHRA